MAITKIQGTSVYTLNSIFNNSRDDHHENFQNMKKIILFTALTLIWMIASSVFAQINVFHVDKNTVQENKDGVYYSLPRTVIKVNVTVDRIENYKGPYAEYALKYRGLKNVVESNSVEYKITGIKVTTSAEPDPDQYYFIELGTKLSKGEKAGLFSFTESGLILGSIQDLSLIHI